jgi:hypothetical protein
MRGFRLTIAGIIVLFLCFGIALTATRMSAVSAATSHQLELCQALQGLDNAKDGITWPATPDAGEQYAEKVIVSVHQVYLSQGCPKTLDN